MTFKLDNNLNGGYFIIYDDLSAILITYGKFIKYINFMSGYVYKNINKKDRQKYKKVNESCKCIIS